MERPLRGGREREGERGEKGMEKGVVLNLVQENVMAALICSSVYDVCVCTCIYHNVHVSLQVKVVLPPHVRAHLLQRSLFKLESTWQWVVTVLDVAEGQLQRGQDFDAQVSLYM